MSKARKNPTIIIGEPMPEAQSLSTPTTTDTGVINRRTVDLRPSAEVLSNNTSAPPGTSGGAQLRTLEPERQVTTLTPPQDLNKQAANGQMMALAGLAILGAIWYLNRK